MKYLTQQDRETYVHPARAMSQHTLRFDPRNIAFQELRLARSWYQF
jgi:hypothetical protein